MGYMDDAVDEAVKRLKEPHNEKNGLIIWQVAQKYGAPVSELAKALKERQEKSMSTKERIDIDKVERLAREKKMDLTELTEAAGLSHDVLRNIKRKPGTPSRLKTVQKVAEALGVEAGEILKGEEVPATEMLTAQEVKILNMIAIWNELTPEEATIRILKNHLSSLTMTDAIMDLKL